MDEALLRHRHRRRQARGLRRGRAQAAEQGRRESQRSQSWREREEERERGRGDDDARREGTRRRRAPTATAPRDVRRGGSAAAPAELKALGAANAELKLAVERTEQEREFYFEKLQDIEFLCQRPEFADTALARVVEKILYFTEGKPDVDAIIRECRDAPEGEAAAPVPAAPLTVATETIVPAEEEAVATPTFDEAAALGAALENECVDLTAPSSPLVSSLCAPKGASTRAPLSPQPTNAL